MSIPTQDATLSALLLPLLQGQLAWPGRGLFLRARVGAPLLEAGLAGLQCEQSFKPDAQALLDAGLELIEPEAAQHHPQAAQHHPQAAQHHPQAAQRYPQAAQRYPRAAQRYPLILVLPPRQRDAARALWARAVALAEPDGRILASAPNDEGARSHEADLARLTGPVSSLSKHKCRVFWSGPVRAPDAELLQQWQSLDAIGPIAAGRFLSRPGLFAWDRIDPGSALLAQHLPETLHGEAADLGAGFGYLAAELLARCPGIVRVDLFEAEQRALELARRNFAAEQRAELGFHWHDVSSGLPRRYDVIVTNPPFHDGARTRADLGRSFIRVAAQALHPAGALWLVANRHLAYEQLLASEFARVRTVVQAQGFKVLEAIKSGERQRQRA